VLAGSDVSSAAGLTQIVASTGKQFLRMHVNTDVSRRLTRAIYRAALRGHFVRAHRLAVPRRHVDERFAPIKSLRATVRYLTKARGYLGRNDLAVVSYHMGIGNLQHVVAGRGGDSTSYAQLYFGSAPDRHGAAWRRLASLGDMSRDYYWKVLAAERVMRLYRHDPAALAYESRLQGQKSSSEEVTSRSVASWARKRTSSAVRGVSTAVFGHPRLTSCSTSASACTSSRVCQSR
jgi:hypothetical protein